MKDKATLYQHAILSHVIYTTLCYTYSDLLTIAVVSYIPDVTMLYDPMLYL